MLNERIKIAIAVQLIDSKKSVPVVTLDWARPRHKSLRELLALGIDPSALKTALGKHRFGVTMREWEAEQGRMHAGFYLCPLCGVSRS